MAGKDQAGRNCIGVAHRHSLCQLMIRTRAASARLWEVKRLIEVKILGRVFGPDRVLVGLVPINLAGVNISGRCGRLTDEVIAGGVRSECARHIGRRQQSPEVRRARVNPACGNDVQSPARRKNAPARSVIGIAGAWVKHHPLLQLDGGAFRGAHVDRCPIRIKERRAKSRAKISLAVTDGRDKIKVSLIRPLRQDVPIPEKENLVLLDGPTHRRPVIVEDVFGRARGMVKEITGVQRLVRMETIESAMDRVGPGFGYHVGGRAGGEAFFHIEV